MTTFDMSGKSRNLKQLLMLTTATALFASQPAFAQDVDADPSDAPAGTAATGGASAPAPADALGDIIVTARRKEESLQRVPIAVTAVTEETMQTANIFDARSLMSHVPGFHNSTRQPGNANISGLARIRGVTGVGLYFADAPYPDRQWTFFGPFFDIERIEALKGPQGTLFGRASNAGAIVVQPRRPRDEFGGTFAVELGDYNRRSFEGALDIPVVSDSVLLRVAYKNYTRGGYIRDAITDYKSAKDAYNILRGTLVLKPAEWIENETLFQRERISHFEFDARVLNDFNMLPVSQNPQAAAQAALNGMTVAEFYAVRDQLLGQQTALGPRTAQGWSTGCPASAISPATKSTIPGANINNVIPQACTPGIGSATNHVLINKTTFHLTDDLQIKNIVNYIWGTILQGPQEADHTRLLLFDGNAKGTIKQKFLPTFSEELQLAGTLFDGRVDFVTGLFYLKQKLTTRPSYAAFSANLNDVVTSNRTNNRTWAVYGQANVKLAETLTFTGGIRYNNDRSFVTNFVHNPTTFDIVSQTGGAGTAIGEGHWSAISYTAGLQWQVDPDNMIYLTNAKGYSTGGLQNVPGRERFEPDTLNNFELGIKSTTRFGDGWALRANFSAYYGFFNNVKVSSTILRPIPGTSGFTVGTAISNAAKAHIRGAEFDIQLAKGNDFSLTAFGGFTDPKYTKFPSINPITQQPVDLSDSPFVNTPKWKFGISPTVHAPIDRDKYGDVSLTADFSYNSQYWINFTKPLTPSDPANPNTGAICKVRRTAANGYGPLSADGKWAYKNCAPSLYTLNVSLNWRDVMGNQGLDAAIVVTNVTNNTTPFGITTVYDAFGFNTADPSPPRMIYGSLRYSF